MRMIRMTEGPGDGPPAKQGVRITVGDLAIEQ